MSEKKKRFDWRAAFEQAVENTRANASRGEWYDGYKAGASAVAVEMYRLEREASKPTPEGER
jgi:hypothetical protein